MATAAQVVTHGVTQGEVDGRTDDGTLNRYIKFDTPQSVTRLSRFFVLSPKKSLLKHTAENASIYLM